MMRLAASEAFFQLSVLVNHYTQTGHFCKYSVLSVLSMFGTQDLSGRTALPESDSVVIQKPGVDFYCFFEVSVLSSQ